MRPAGRVNFSEMGQSTLQSISWLCHQVFPHFVTIYAAQVCENDKKSQVLLSDMFELQEYLISIFNPPACGERGDAALVYLGLRGLWRGKPVIEPTILL